MKRSASAPGKIILFGEHAVVFGEPSIATAIGMRLKVEASDAAESTFNGVRVERNATPHAYHALNLAGMNARITVSSEIPAGAGLGSSAALSVALVLAMTGGEESEVAARAYGVELAAQMRASPADTSVCTHGHSIFISGRQEEGELWSVAGKEVRWHISHLDIPQLPVVIGYTGIPAATGPLVMKVKRHHERYSIVREAIAEIGQLTLEAVRPLTGGDMVAVGELMERNQRLLSIIGVSSHDIEKLLDAVRKYSYGAKLTGAGGGGSIIALTDRPDKVVQALELRGGKAFVTSISAPGARREEL